MCSANPAITLEEGRTNMRNIQLALTNLFTLQLLEGFFFHLKMEKNLKVSIKFLL